VPSSTSSFDRAPQGGWGKRVLVASFFSILFLTSIELIYRSLGHQPSVTDTPDIWSDVRASIEKTEDSDKSVLLLGASRMLTGFDLDTFHQMYPNRNIFQLAVEGKWPIATLKDIAEHSNFSGTVIVSVTAESFLNDFLDHQKQHIDHYHKVYMPSFDHKINTRLQRFFQSKIVLLQHSLHPKLVALSLAKTKALPKPHMMHTEYSREKDLDFSSKNQGFQNMARNLENPKDFEQDIKGWEINYTSWLSNIREIRELVEKIQKRGGKVVFVRLPYSPIRFSIFERYMPKEKYWNQIYKYTNALTVHFQDMPRLSSIEMPDESHIDVKDKPFFTRVLLEYLQTKDVFL